ncbi:LysR family transcriptional regulator [Microbulbifer sp. OS29]|uniref:LysR family transcriptional regulator n=1 Tax=Microbulbifer okhotskensis TaxID=2926617 RepID=A0A9X2EPW8_9GAMM|nr:LysR family transcriptional regulator [Microbulbifer okhotskensis]MCO1336197.1 LysR family transcriptional regulator [Microbulbifer okhotskensis]
MDIDHIEDLQVFTQVVDCGTLAAAGRVLNLSPTLMSRRLARLENTLGVRLLERTTRSLHVTDEGRTFYARCRRILMELELAQEELRPNSKVISGIVRLVVPTSMLAYGIMNALSSFLSTHPALTVQISLSDESVNLLAEGWDIATHIGAPSDSTHIGKRLGSISPRLAATAEYLAREGIPESPLDLSKHQCVRFYSTQPQEYWPVIDKEGVTIRVPIGGQLLCHDVISIYTAMCAGIGIGLIPKAALDKAKNEGKLIEVLPGYRVDSNTLYALIPAGRQTVPRIKLVADWLAKFISSLNGED